MFYLTSDQNLGVVVASEYLAWNRYDLKWISNNFSKQVWKAYQHNVA